MKAVVSVLVPVYNVDSYLPQCIDSILGQTYPHLQIILLDDGSTDKSFEIMQFYASKDSRLEIYHQQNHGVSITRNKLLEKVKGDYILFIDADDWLELNMIKFLVDKLEEYQADMVTCGNVIDDARASKTFTQKIYFREKAIERFLYHQEFRGTLWNKLMKASIIQNCKFQPGISLGEDALFCWHVLQNTSSVLFTDRQLYHYRMNDDSICHSTFGPKKLSAHYAWEQICAETMQWYPHYLTIAQARHCIEDVLLLREAVKSKYQVQSDIELLQSTISKYWHCMNKVQITSLKMKFFAMIVSKFRVFAKWF